MTQAEKDVAASMGDFVVSVTIIVAAYKDWTTYLIALGVLRVVAMLLIGFIAWSRSRKKPLATRTVEIPAASVMTGVLRADDDKLLLACGHTLSLEGQPDSVRESLGSQSQIPCIECARELANATQKGT